VLAKILELYMRETLKSREETEIAQAVQRQTEVEAHMMSSSVLQGEARRHQPPVDEECYRDGDLLDPARLFFDDLPPHSKSLPAVAEQYIRGVRPRVLETGIRMRGVAMTRNKTVVETRELVEKLARLEAVNNKGEHLTAFMEEFPQCELLISESEMAEIQVAESLNQLRVLYATPVATYRREVTQNIRDLKREIFFLPLRGTEERDWPHFVLVSHMLCDEWDDATWMANLRAIESSDDEV
jgi:hypothetical protein